MSASLVISNDQTIQHWINRISLRYESYRILSIKPTATGGFQIHPGYSGTYHFFTESDLECKLDKILQIPNLLGSISIVYFPTQRIFHIVIYNGRYPSDHEFDRVIPVLFANSLVSSFLSTIAIITVESA